MTKADQRDAAKPAASGVVVPSKDWPIAAPMRPPPSVCIKPCTDDGRAGDMAERLHGQGVEVGADPAELEHRRRKQQDEERQRQFAEQRETNQIVLT